jgi:hypothetical protein
VGKSIDLWLRAWKFSAIGAICSTILAPRKNGKRTITNPFFNTPRGYSPPGSRIVEYLQGLSKP